MTDASLPSKLCPMLSPVVPGPLGKPTLLVVECVGERCAMYQPCQVLPAKLAAFLSHPQYE